MKLDEGTWSSTARSHTVEAYEAYIRAFPNGKYINQARRSINQISDDTEWEIAQTLGTKDAYGEYLRQFPSGRHASKAQQAMSDSDQSISSPISRSNLAMDQSLKHELSSSTLVDLRDENQYTTKLMKDGKKWMSMNLNHKVANSFCYDGKDSNCDKYGRLYTLKAAKKACPPGWHLPSDDEWREMTKNYGGAGHGLPPAGGKQAYKALIEEKNDGFAVQLGGYLAQTGDYLNAGATVTYWSSSGSFGEAWAYEFQKKYAALRRDKFNTWGGFAHAVRCVQD